MCKWLDGKPRNHLEAVVHLIKPLVRPVWMLVRVVGIIRADNAERVMGPRAPKRCAIIDASVNLTPIGCPAGIPDATAEHVRLWFVSGFGRHTVCDACA